jgi:ABC-type amino acid transport substrate-binding protein
VSLVVLASIVAALDVWGVQEKTKPVSNGRPTEPGQQLVYEKRDDTIRCAGGLFEKDSKAVTRVGFNYDLMEEVGKALGKKIVWVEGGRSPFRDPDAFKNDVYDVFCLQFLETKKRSDKMIFAASLLKQPYMLYVRRNDGRFDQNISAADRSNIKVAVSPGSSAKYVVNEDLPKSEKVLLGEDSTPDDAFAAVAASKADVAIETPTAFDDYNKLHPDLLKQAGDRPIRILALGYPIEKSNASLKIMIDGAIVQLQKKGVLDGILKKYPDEAKIFVPLSEN